ncbi:MAG: HAD-IA family hydrolase, partial [Anaerolineae bacterium]|nr:HAD-IA family hydrolase [Anaerolineae bacterium]
IPVGIASTAHPDSIKDLVRYTMGEDFLDCFAFILGGDVVKQKKPDPAIYNLAREKLGVKASHCVVIEDSSNGLTAAKQAGMVCTVTPSFYSSGEDFSAADMIVSCLGDAGEPAKPICVPGDLPEFSLVTPDLLDHLVQVVGVV